MVEYVQDARLVKAFGVFLDVFAVVRKELLLDCQRAFEAFPLCELCDDCRHSTQHTIVHEGVVKRFHFNRIEGRFCCHALRDGVDLPVLVATGPQELFEIHGAHGVVGFVTHAVALDAVVVYSQHGPAAYDVEASVLLEELERRGYFGTLLHLVEENERVVIDKALGRVDEGDVLHDVRCAVAVGNDGFVAGFFHEVDFNDRGIDALGEAAYRRRLADLSRPSDHEGVPTGVAMPLGQKRVRFSSEVHFFKHPLHMVIHTF